jgi:hypothetical protein
VAIYKMQCSTWYDSLAPRDAIVINPHFQTVGPLIDEQALCDDMATAISEIVGSTHQVQVKMYEVPKPDPNPPVAEKLLNANQSAPATVPRELALCLSYYAGTNVKRRRGRLYMPACWGLSSSDLGVRPTSGSMTLVGNRAQRFEDLGGVDVDWVVFSPTNASAHAVTDWWVDNEWDVVRSRGLRADARVVGTTDEDTLLRVALSPQSSQASDNES